MYNVEIPSLLQPINQHGNPIDVKSHLFPYELEILAREVILNGSSFGSKSFTKSENLFRAIEWIRELSEEMNPIERQDISIYRYMHKLAHSQFPWQSHFNTGTIIRYFRIFGTQEIAQLVKSKTNLTTKQLFTIGFGFTSIFVKKTNMPKCLSFQGIEITDELRDIFLNSYSTDFEQLRLDTKVLQAYDYNWANSFFPLKSRPLIINPESRILCPIPELLTRRYTEGLYYDLVNEAGFGDLFGLSFQQYVGDVMKASLPMESFSIIAESDYFVGSKRKDGVDWIVQDATANLFIECKTKRLTHKAKFMDEETFNSEIDILARAIVQNYLNIEDSLAGKTNWEPNDKPSFSVICTLEDWWIFNSEIVGVLEEKARILMRERGISQNIMSDIPFIVASITEIEKVIQVIGCLSIFEVLSDKSSAHSRNTLLSSYVKQSFPKECQDAKKVIFEDDFEEIFKPSKLL